MFAIYACGVEKWYFCIVNIHPNISVCNCRLSELMKNAILVAFLMLCFVSVAEAQDSVAVNRVIPGAEYRAGFFHRFLFGSNWRDLWTTPIAVEALDLSSFAGGLTPIKLTDDSISRSLQLKGANGKSYIFRPLNKDPKILLDPSLRGSLVGDLVQDFISTTNPLACLITTPILDAVGIMNSPFIVSAMPVDDRLGEYKSTFGGQLGTLEVNSHNKKGNALISTPQLFEKLDEDNSNYVDAREYLKTRMIDVFFGDWDRNIDKWGWAGNAEGAKTRWQPVPHDHDHAFSRYGGIASIVVSGQIRQIKSCDESYPAMIDLTWSGRHLDRRLLSSLEKPVWDSLKTFLLSVLTDSLIEYSVSELPKEMFEKEGANLIRTMRSRRDKFAKAIDEYYDLLAGYVDIWASNVAEFATVNRINDDSVVVELFKRDKETGGIKGEAFFHRTFDRHETKEIRLFLQDGDDFAKVEGNVSGSIPTRIIGGYGKDELVDSSNVKGYALGFLPFSITRKKTIFYDNGDQNEFVYGSSTKVDNSEFIRPLDDSSLYEPKYRDWGHEWGWGPWLNYGTDDGAFLGVIFDLYNYSFRSIPYQNKISLRGGYALKAERFIADFNAEFPNVWKGTFHIDAHASGLGALNYFGFGNETKYLPASYDKDFYKIKQRMFVLAPGYEYPLFKDVTLRATGALRYIQTPIEGLPDSAYLKLTKPFGIGDKLITTFTASGTYDTRNNTTFPETGLFVNAQSVWTPEIIDTKYSYTKAIGDARAYLTAHVLGGVTLALRVHGEKLWGKYPFFDASYLGGGDDLRGYYRERYAGDASMFGAAELRVNLGVFNILVPGNYGFKVGAETGKVFIEKEESKTFHTSIVWGFWIAPISKDNIVGFTVASSEERTAIYLNAGFGF